MNRPPRRVRSPPPFGYDQRMIARGADTRPLQPDYDDPYAPATPFDPMQSAPAAFSEQAHPHGQPQLPPSPSQQQQQQQYPIGYRDNRSLPSTYRATLSRDPAAYGGGMGNSAPYKILCITNINHKVSDGPVKEALASDFSRFGDISVSICHDSGERLVYIYFRTYEDAREARHAKARTLLFDRPIEIEPIYEPRSSPDDSPPPPSQQQHQPPLQQPPPPQQVYARRRSITPPEYYGSNEPPGPPPQHQQHPHSARRQPPPPPMAAHHRGLSPFSHSHSSRHPPVLQNHSMPPAGPPMPYGGRYYMPPAHLPPAPSPPHESYRSYHPQPPLAPNPNHFQPGHSSSYHPHHSGYGPQQMVRDRDRAIAEGHMGARSPRGYEPYYPVDHRGFPPPHLPRGSASIHSGSSHHHHPYSHHYHPNNHHHPTTHHQNVPSNVHHQTSMRHVPPPPHPDHPRYMSRDFRREKFSSENYANEPEEGRPSRVLFINNIDSSKTEIELRGVFDTFGQIEEIEIKKITPDMSSALIKFSSMDCAYKAKTATNGKYLGSLKCRISYGKVSASRRLWIGGFGPNTTITCLEDEFGKFGNITSLDYISGRPYAYIEYESANQAQFATHHLKGTFMTKAERRLRIEYVDPVDKSSKLDSSQQVSDISSRSRTTNESWSTSNDQDTSPSLNNLKRSVTPTDVNSKRPHLISSIQTNATKYPETDNIRAGKAAANLQSKVSERSISKSPPQPAQELNNDTNELNNNQDANEQLQQQRDRQEVEEGTNKLQLETSVGEKVLISAETPIDLERLVQSKSIRDIVDCCSVFWFSQLVLRNFNFPSKIFMCSGQKTTIDKYLQRSNGENGADSCPILRITQRWRLHPQPKLDEVKRRMESGNLGMLIITSRPDLSPNLSSPSCKTPQSSTSQSGGGAIRQNGDNESPAAVAAIGLVDDKTTSGSQSNEGSLTQSRPLKNLISYLEQKDAAGVISLDGVDHCGDQTVDGGGPKLLYAFPPGDFALNLLKRKAPHLAPDSTKEEFLLGVIVGGGGNETKI